MNIEETRTLADERIFAKLNDSPFFQTYRKAFMDATGMGLSIIPADDDVQSDGGLFHQSEFCAKLNMNAGGSCAQCQHHRRMLKRELSDRIVTKTCFAGMRESLIPIRSGDRTFAYLITGEVFTTEPGQMPEVLRESFDELPVEAGERKELKELWQVGRVMTKAQYEGTITLLAAFALQVSELLNRLLIEENNAEPEVVMKAKRYVNAHLEDKISLESVARHVGVSPYYFCKIFKQSAGMTLTEFVNRRRIEWAKRRLLNPQERVTEVAFDVGFQSISQFNRSFLKYVGQSPTRFRDHQARAKLTNIPAA
ncbi:MAG: helix-turn-helix domain-containing protein [Verrucomicrobiales bacterium]|nr:helix-turn-helix domain-containing protein [Verrucomicrobiales bacterium]